MKKYRFLLFLIVIACALTVYASAEIYKDTLITTNYEVGLKFEIKDNVLSISGMVDKEDLQYLVIAADKQYVLPITEGVKFKTSIDFSALTNEKVTIGVFLGTEVSKPFTSVFYGDDIVLVKNDDKFMFAFNEKVVENNDKLLSGWVYEKYHLNSDQPAAVKMITSNIVADIESDYEKARAIHRWVADNIYYDENYALKTTNVTPLTPVEVLSERRSVCEGYSNLTVAMLNCAGIPAFVTRGYALGVDEEDSWNEVNFEKLDPNHAWVEAFVDGKWIIMDPTWDSYNKTFRDKKTEEENPMHRYFDVTTEMLALKHMALERPLTFGNMGISVWAEKEAKAAVESNLVTKEILTTMKNNITRAEFCKLVINMITEKYSKSIETILDERNLELDYSAFVDTSSATILSANALGIVYGKEDKCFDPYGFITRQEAATMLYRVAKVFGVTSPNSEKLEFADAAQFAEWGKEGIFFVSASLSKQGMRVMGGVENNCFNPSGFYTKEQSILTIYRLFNTYSV